MQHLEIAILTPVALWVQADWRCAGNAALLLDLLQQGYALLLFVFEIFLSLCCVPIYLPFIHFSHSFIADSPALLHVLDAGSASGRWDVGATLSTHLGISAPLCVWFGQVVSKLFDSSPCIFGVPKAIKLTIHLSLLVVGGLTCITLGLL